MRLAHISDLHVGRIKTRRIVELRDSLNRERIDHVLLTGDVTDGGKATQLKAFRGIFDGMAAYDRMTIVPGNHDRLGDDVSQEMMDKRVYTKTFDGVYIIKVDTTGPHNKALVLCHGIIELQVLASIEAALDAAPKNHVVVIMFHHHPMPAAPDSIWERILGWLNFSFLTKELTLGRRLIEMATGKADLILHGHMHTPSSLVIPGPRELRIYNAGCTPQLRRYRIFECVGGKLNPEVSWQSVARSE